MENPELGKVKGATTLELRPTVDKLEPGWNQPIESLNEGSTCGRQA